MRKTRLLTLLLLLITAVTGAVAQSQQWTSGACTVTLSDGVMTVSGTGPMEDYYDSYQLPWYSYCSDVETIVIESGVSSIGNSAFAKCYNLESVSIPASVTRIGARAFENCGSDAAALTVSFAEGSTLESIGEGAFAEANLKSIDIPNGVTSIGDNVFASCYNLESVSIPASVTSIGRYAFQRCGEYTEALTVSFAEGSTLESIGEFAFNESILKSIDIPNSVTSIGGGAFNSCYILAKVNIFASYLTTYGAGAFEDNADGRKIYVHPDAVDTYKAGWPDYADDIEAMTLYATSVKEGTEDAENWSATPSQPTAGQKVTINYAGTKSVKSVTAKRKATTGNITVYFTDAQNYGDVHVYYWNDGGEWPGTAMTEVGTNDYNQKIYRAEIPATAVGIIFNGNGKQTVDITDNIEDGSWWYTTNEYEGTKNKVAYVDMCPENIEVTNVDDNKWTFTMPDYNVELDIEYYPAHPVTISDGDIDAANWSATPTEQSVGQNVTLQYTGRKKIKKITIEAAPTPAIDYSTAQLGDLFYSDGTFSATLEEGKTPIGVIAYLDKEGTDDDEICEKSNGAGHGLVLCLKNAASTIAWSTENVSKFSGQEVNSVDDLKRTTNVSGYTNTATLTVDAATAGKYPAAYKALKYNGLTAPTGTTGWFLPSAQQLLKMIEGLGGLTDGAPNFYENWFDTNHNGADKLEAALSKAGSGNYDSMTSAYSIYWSSSESADIKAVSLGVDATGTGFGYGFLWGADNKDNTYTMYRVRPVLAF